MLYIFCFRFDSFNVSLSIIGLVKELDLQFQYNYCTRHMPSTVVLTY